MTKPTYIISDMSLFLKEKEEDAGSEIAEFKSEKAAIAAGKQWIKTLVDEEVWVWKLSHIISKPIAEPDVVKVA